MTRTPRLGEPCHRIVVIGAGTAGQSAREALLAAGVTDVAMLDDRAVTSSVFDDTTDTWLLTAAGGEVLRARVVIAADRPPYVPWIPEFDGRDDFRGASFHAAQWDPGFDPTGKRVAVVGADAVAGHYLGRLVESAASVTVFVHAPRRIVTELPLPITRVKRWLRRRIGPTAQGERPRTAPALVRSPIGTVTASGIRTCDAVEHRADALIYGTGFAIPDRIPDATLVGTAGLTIRQAWSDGMEPYFGVAVHGFPNYFFIGGPDIDARARYVAECVQLLQRTDSTRIGVRRSSQQVFNERARITPAEPPRVPAAFDLSSNAGEDETYDGAATLTIAGTDHPVRVRLAGHLDPLDGRYHWQGTVFSPLPDGCRQARSATLTVGERSAPARIVEQTPWGTHSVAGVGAPPYALG